MSINRMAMMSVDARRRKAAVPGGSVAVLLPAFLIHLLH
jgi:hypothetical protein